MPAKSGAPTVLILAAGKGTRLRSKTIKLLHPVAGRPMAEHVVEAARALRPSRIAIVIGHQAERMREALAAPDVRFVVQAAQLGTGHAVLQASRALAGASTVLVLNGDLPTLRAATLKRFVAAHRRSRAALSVLTAEVDDPTGYGRILRDAAGTLQRIVEQADASPAERAVREINCVLYCADPPLLLRALRGLRPNNAQGEYYITDAVHALLARGSKVVAVRHADAAELLGVNTRAELSHAVRTLFDRKAEALQDGGGTLVDPQRVWIDPRASIGRDSVIWPGVVIEGSTRIGSDCVVRSGSRIADSIIGDDVEIRDHCVITTATIGAGARIGPFAHLRPGSDLDRDTHVGNFVELKKARLGRGSKANHLAYLGDATIGPGCNIGAGTITCNYDGKHKHPTVLGRGVFIGSDSQLVAPVTLGDGAYIAAGSTVTSNVPAGALAISRTRQKNIEGWVERTRRGGKRAAGRKR